MSTIVKTDVKDIFNLLGLTELVMSGKEFGRFEKLLDELISAKCSGKIGKSVIAICRVMMIYFSSETDSETVSSHCADFLETYLRRISHNAEAFKRNFIKHMERRFGTTKSAQIKICQRERSVGSKWKGFAVQLGEFDGTHRHSFFATASYTV